MPLVNYIHDLFYCNYLGDRSWCECGVQIKNKIAAEYIIFTVSGK